MRKQKEKSITATGIIGTSSTTSPAEKTVIIVLLRKEWRNVCGKLHTLLSCCENYYRFDYDGW